MARFLTALALLSAAPSAVAFCPAAPAQRSAALRAERPRSANGMDQDRAVPSWTAPASSAPPADPQPPVVDPPKRENGWTNAADKPRSYPRTGLSKLL